MTILEKRLWTKNKANCYICNCEFHRLFSFKLTFLFPHHCRVCGECICGTCSTYRHFGNHSYFRVCLVCDITRKSLFRKDTGSSQYQICILTDSKFFSINRHLEFTSDIYGMSALVKRCKNRAISIGDVLVSVNNIDTLFLSLDEIVRVINHSKYPIILEFIPEKEYYQFISTVLETVRKNQEPKQRKLVTDSNTNRYEVGENESEESDVICTFWTLGLGSKKGHEEQRSRKKNGKNILYSRDDLTRKGSFIDGVELKQLKDERAKYLAGVSSASSTTTENNGKSEGNENNCRSSTSNENNDKEFDLSMQAQ